MIRRSVQGIVVSLVALVGSVSCFAAEVGGKPEKSDVIVTYVQPSGAFTPIWVAFDAIQAQFAYMDEKEFPQARNSDPKEFFDNSFVENLEKAGFFKTVGLVQ